MRVETDITTRTAESLIGQAVILVIMYVRPSKFTVFLIGNVIMYSTLCRLIIFSIRVSSLILTISPSEMKGRMSKLQINLFFYLELLDFYNASSLKQQTTCKHVTPLGVNDSLLFDAKCAIFELYHGENKLTL